MNFRLPNRLAIGAALLVIAGCNQGPEQANQAAPTANLVGEAQPRHPVQALPIEEQHALAFKAAFEEREVMVGDERLRYSPGDLVWIGDRAVLISPGENLDECHACTGALAIHYLEPEGEGFRVAGSWPALVKGAGYGKPPSDWRVSDQFAEYPVLIEEGGYTAQGCTSGGITLTELRPERPVRSARIPTVYSNQSGFGADNGAEIEGEVDNIQKGVSFDVTYSGSRDFTESWVRRGDTFELRGGETRMPTC